MRSLLTLSMLSALSLGTIVCRAEPPKPAVTLEGSVGGGQGESGFVVGWDFQLARKATVTALGVIDSGPPGLVDSHRVVILRPDEEIVVEAVVPERKQGRLLGQFRYVPIEPTVLAADTRYVIVAQYVAPQRDRSTTLLPEESTTFDANVRWLDRRRQVSDEFVLPKALGKPSDENPYGSFGPNFLIGGDWSDLPEPPRETSPRTRTVDVEQLVVRRRFTDAVAPTKHIDVSADGQHVIAADSAGFLTTCQVDRGSSFTLRNPTHAPIGFLPHDNEFYFRNQYGRISVRACRGQSNGGSVLLEDRVDLDENGRPRLQHLPSGRHGIATAVVEGRVLHTGCDLYKGRPAFEETAPFIRLGPGGRHYVTRDGATVKVYEWPRKLAGQFVLPDGRHDEADLELSFDGSRLFASIPGTRLGHLWQLYDVEADRLLRQHVAPREDGTYRHAYFRPDGSLLSTVTDDDGWRFATGDPEKGAVKVVRDAYQGELGPVSPRRRFATVVEDGSIRTLVDLAETRSYDLHGEHPQGVNDVAFTPDEQFLVTGGAEGKIVLWHLPGRHEVPVETGGQPAEVAQTSPAPRPPATQPRPLATPQPAPMPEPRPAPAPLIPEVKIPVAGNSDLRLELVQRFPGHQDAILSVDFSPTGRQALSTGWDNRLIVWDLEEGKPLKQYPSLTRPAGFLPGRGTAFAHTVDGKTLVLLDLTAERARGRLVHHKPLRRDDSTRNAIYIRLDYDSTEFDHVPGSGVAVVKHGGRWSPTRPNCSVYDLRNGRVVFRGGVDDVAVSRNGRYLALRKGNGVVVSDMATGKDVARLPIPGPIESTQMGVSPDGARFAASVNWTNGDTTFVEIDLRSGKPVASHARKRFDPQSGEVPQMFDYVGKDVVFGVFGEPNGRQFTPGLWNTRTGESLATVVETFYAGHDLAYEYLEPRTHVLSPTGRLAWIWNRSSRPGKLVDVRTGRALSLPDGHNGRVTSVAFAPDESQLLTGGEDRTMILWKIDGLVPLDEQAVADAEAEDADDQPAAETPQSEPAEEKSAKSAERRRRKARAKLSLAKQLLRKGQRASAQRWLREIVSEFADTPAAEEARELLGKR